MPGNMLDQTRSLRLRSHARAAVSIRRAGEDRAAPRRGPPARIRGGRVRTVPATRMDTQTLSLSLSLSLSPLSHHTHTHTHTHTRTHQPHTHSHTNHTPHSHTQPHTHYTHQPHTHSHTNHTLTHTPTTHSLTHQPHTPHTHIHTHHMGEQPRSICTHAQPRLMPRTDEAGTTRRTCGPTTSSRSPRRATARFLRTGLPTVAPTRVPTIHSLPPSVSSGQVCPPARPPAQDPAPPPPPSRTKWTRLVHPSVLNGHVSSLLLCWHKPHRSLFHSHGPRRSLPPPPATPPPRTKWTRRVPHPALIGHAPCLSGPRRSLSYVATTRTAPSPALP